jgi:protein tyrosine/serine phosphatase
MVDSVLDRRVTLTGSFNFRDLGGLKTADGRTVRRGRLFRSDELHQLTADDVEILAGIGIASLLDLRSLEEVTSRRAELLFARGVKHHHLPFSDEIAPDPERLKAMGQMPLDQLYSYFLDSRKEKVGNLFALLAEETTYPAVVHCAAGKDRTGVASAIVLRTLGVPDSEIVADYALTDAAMVKVIARIQEEQNGKFADLPPALMRAVPETMTGFLARLDATYGSTDRFLADAGVSESTVNQVRLLLLEA